MFEQQAPGSTPPMPTEVSWPDDAVILGWIAAWQPAREDVMGLLAAYAEADGGHDISSFTPLVEQLDSAMRLLQYRVDWLRNYLGHAARPPRHLD